MNTSARKTIWTLGSFLAAMVLVAGVSLVAPAAHAKTKAPIRIGVIAPFSAIDGASIINGAEMAVDEINKAGGIEGRPVKLFKYDNHASATDAVRAFQRAVKQDHVVAIAGTFISEVALAIEPWSARLHTPFIVTGAASTKITGEVHNHYARDKYVFHNWLNSDFQGRVVCDFAKDELVGKLGYKTAVVMSEDAAWTQPLDVSYLKCLPKAGLKVLDHIRFSPDTNDFTPLFNKVESEHADVIIAGWAHVGVKPTVQWHQQQVPALLAGINAQAGASSFWKSTNGDTEGVITGTAGVSGAAVTPKSEPFTKAYTKRYHTTPAYNAYSTYDSIYMLKAAIEREHSTNADKLVTGLEKTDYLGTVGRVKFYGRNDLYTHGMEYGKDLVQTVVFQWQHGKQVPVWPHRVSLAKLEVPSFVKQHVAMNR